MTPVRTISKYVYLIFSGAGLILLPSAALRCAAQEGAPPTLSRRPGYSAKLAGKPRSADAETSSIEIPPPPPNPSRAMAPILGTQERRTRRVAANHALARPDRAENFAVNRISPAVNQPLRRGNSEPAEVSETPDPEAQRIVEDLKRLHDDREARQAFYDDLRRTVREVRADVRSSDSPEDNADTSAPQNVRPFRPEEKLLPQTRLPDSFSHPSKENRESRQPDSYSHPSVEDHESPQPDSTAPDNPQASLTTGRGGINGETYLMVVRWAKANGTPVPLALGVAWMESHMNPYPARGAAGEVGMFQIMPTRCALEGWPARRLSEPQFNAWMGTMLLARYYQEEGSMARAAAKYVAGPGVFNKKYSKDVWAYINWYASTVDSYASYFSRYQT